MNLTRTTALVALLGLATPTGFAVQTYHPPTDVVNPDQAALDAAFVALSDEHQTATYAWWDAMDAVRDRNEKGAMEPYPVSPDGNFYPRFWALSERGQIDARLWCLSNFGFSEVPKERRKVAKLRMYLDLIDNASQSHGVALVGTLASESEDWGDSLGRDLAFALLDELVIVASNADVGATALMAKASSLEWSDVENAEDLAMQQYESLVERYPDHELAARAAGKIFASENLQIGMQVPDIVGVDVDGNPLKLSDYRGKVAVIDFWGFW